MNKEVQEKAQALAPVFGEYDRNGSWWRVTLRALLNFVKVFAYKLGFFLAVETLSKAGMACIAWPLLNALMLWGMHKADKDIKLDNWPLSLVLAIEAIFVGMFMFKGTTKKLLDMAGQALLEWAKNKR